MTTRHEELADLVTIAGRPAVVVPVGSAEQLHLLVREVARRCRRLESRR